MMHLRNALSDSGLAISQRREHAAEPAPAASTGPLASARGGAKRGLAVLAVSGLLGLAAVAAGGVSPASATEEPPPHPWLAASVSQDPPPSPWLASVSQDPEPSPWLTASADEGPPPQPWLA
jgi:hypothetical protein